MFFFSAFGQNQFIHNDTIYIYEEVVVYDTVYVFDTIWAADAKDSFNFIKPIYFNALQLKTTGKPVELLIISGTKAATFPTNGIILNRNINNIESMKKLNFLGVVLFAFNSMVIAQAGYGISGGGGTWWAACNKPIVSPAYSPAFNLGAFFDLPLHKRLVARGELNYRFMKNNYSYKASVYDICWETPSTNLCGIVGDAESASDYHQVSLPVTFGYKLNRFVPYTGFEYNYRISEKWLDKKINSFGLKLGLSYAFTNKISLVLDYYKGFTKDYEHTGRLMDCSTLTVLETNRYNWKSSRVDLNVCYNFGKRNSGQ
ncbi:MAG: outer membrane beta-barrel protein [Bacteroidales bacterium]|nr:outer membrane beta-barrel protein [Bacteroidales bacterium]